MILPLLERVLASAILSDPRAEARLEALAGRSVAVAVTGTPVEVLVTATLDGLRLGPADGTPADARVEAPPFTLLRLLASPDTSTALSGGEVTVTGDTRALQDLQNLLRGLQVDWEALAARATGAPVAGALATVGGRAAAWGRRARERLGEDLRDALQEELRLLAPPAGVADLVDSVDELREAADRLAQRVARLEARRGRGHA
jgi:ubiquinone biosynthesis protein UbiJ